MKRQRIDKSVLTFGEPLRIRSEKHRKFIASLPCFVCGRTDVQAAHFGSWEIMSGTACDSMTAPLCVECHRTATDWPKGELDWWIEVLVMPFFRHYAAQSPDPRIRAKLEGVR